MLRLCRQLTNVFSIIAEGKVLGSLMKLNYVFLSTLKS